MPRWLLKADRATSKSIHSLNLHKYLSARPSHLLGMAVSLHNTAQHKPCQFTLYWWWQEQREGALPISVCTAVCVRTGCPTMIPCTSITAKYWSHRDRKLSPRDPAEENGWNWFSHIGKEASRNFWNSLFHVGKHIFTYWLSYTWSGGSSAHNRG